MADGLAGLIPALESSIGYTFANKELAREALTHASHSHDRGDMVSNERLEFLGDTVLQILVSDHLFHVFPAMAEGQLSRVRAAVVSAPSLKRVADGLGLGDLLMLGRGMELTGGRGNANILADAVEAVLAAVYLDSDLDHARAIILPRLKDAIAEAANKGIQWDSKTRLQEILQRNGDIKIEYVVDDVTGPAHDRLFTVSVVVEGKPLAQGTGPRKKAAQQQAAQAALALMESTNNESGEQRAPQET